MKFRLRYEPAKAVVLLRTKQDSPRQYKSQLPPLLQVPVRREASKDSRDFKGASFPSSAPRQYSVAESKLSDILLVRPLRNRAYWEPWRIAADQVDWSPGHHLRANRIREHEAPNG